MPDKTQGQQFAEQMRYFLSIGTRTRRNRKGGDLHRDIADWIKSAAMEPGTFPPDQEAVFKAAFDAACSWFKWIKMGRSDYRVCDYVNSLSPYRFCALLGDMIDEHIATSSQGGQYFAQLVQKAA
ncbi:hypothetical protein [Streptomyces chiangmaiensis]|uniref:hypothetical protein n=1 Tax=Streptomyces chiangmaiensis TaxID=766497 RepID=UPI0031E73636